MLENPPIGLMLVPMPLAAGVLGGILVGLVTGSWLWGIVALVIAALVAAAIAYLYAEAIALRLLGARPLLEGGSHALRNQLEELCAKAGLGEPDLYTIGPGAPAIASVGRSGPGALIVTDGLSEDLTVVELEAAVARELGRTRTGATTVDTLAVPFLTAPFGFAGGLGNRLLHWIRGGDHDAKTDLEGVAITRYPPGMTAALSKMVRPSGPSSVAHLWAVGDTDTGDIGRYGLAERLELLHEL